MGKNEKEWQEVRLGDIVYFNPTEKLIKGSNYKKVSMDCLMPKTRKIENYEISVFNGGSKFRNGDTLMARITPCLENGKTAQVSILDENEIAFGSTEFIVLREKENISDNNFVYYLFNTDYIRNIAIKSMTGTSGRQRVQEDVLKNLVIKLPPLEEQKKIASVLSSLDDKIELNNRMNKILEEMAQTIFKEWFVNFNFPNEDGKPYKDSGGKMIESELGAIPDSWEITNLEEICNIYSGYSYSSKDLSSSSDAMVTIKNFERNGGFKLDGFKEIIISDKVKENHYANLYDVIVAHTDITQKADIIGNPILLLSKGKYNNLIISMDLVKVTLKNNDISNTVLYNILSNINFKNHCLSYSSGTTVLHLSKKALPSYKLAYPNSKLLKKLSNILEPIYKK